MATSPRSKSKPSAQTSLWAELPASPSVSPEDERDWMTRVVTWPSNLLGLLSVYGLDGLSGKTSKAYCRKLKDGPLVPYSGRWKNAGMGSPTGFLTLNSTDWHNAGSVSSLSDILETGDHLRRYCLSAKACAGILRRAEKRGKKLPESLEAVLMAVAATAS